MTFAMSKPAAIVVDDQPFMALVTADVLRDIGIEAVHASEPQRALRLLKEYSGVQLLLTEAELFGEQSGLELALRVAAERPDIPVVLLTRADVRGDLPARIRVLRKPYASAELRTLIAGMTLVPCP